MHHVIVTIDAKGHTTVKAEGYKGPSCADVTKPFIEALGTEAAQVKTPEFYQQPVAAQQQLKA